MNHACRMCRHDTAKHKHTGGDRDEGEHGEHFSHGLSPPVVLLVHELGACASGSSRRRC